MTERKKAEWLLFATTFIWGGTFVILKEGLADISPLLMVAVRFSLASLLLLPFCLKSLKEIDRSILLGGFGLGMLIFLGFFLQTMGLRLTTASKSALITSMMVVFTPLFQLICLKRPPSRNNLIGILVVLIGLWLLTGQEEGNFNRGDLLTLLGAIIFSLYIVLLDPVSRKYDALTLTFLQIVSAAFYGWMVLPWGEASYFRLTRAALSALAYTTLLATLLTGYIQTKYQKETTPTRVVILYAFEPVWAAILGFLILGERIGLMGFLGGVLMILGMIFSGSDIGAGSSDSKIDS